MNKNFKIFQIHGLSGLLLIGFAITGVFCGFIMFPVWAIMVGWNEVIANIFKGPSINYLQASLLWSIVIITVYLALKNSVSIKIHTIDKEMDDLEINKFIHHIEEMEMKENPSEGESK
jgi:hypothetical protein